LCRQTDLILTAAETKKPVNVKKGQFMAPWDMKYVIEKIETAGNRNIIITERGTTFGYNNLVSDMRSLPIMRRFGYPVVYDATHSAQLPGGLGRASGGQREFVRGLCRAAAAMGVDGIFVETHRDPDRALSDGPNMLTLKEFSQTIREVKDIEKAVARDV
jgi:2-dehydro-3-deoxyphosphooctonate aldolase (KDO 8-P synthase)